MVDITYPSLLEHLANPLLDPNYIINRAIIASTNDIVNEINEYVISKIHGEYVEYLSVDSLSRVDDVSQKCSRLSF